MLPVRDAGHDAGLEVGRDLIERLALGGRGDWCQLIHAVQKPFYQEDREGSWRTKGLTGQLFEEVPRLDLGLDRTLIQRLVVVADLVDGGVACEIERNMSRVRC